MILNVKSGKCENISLGRVETENRGDVLALNDGIKYGLSVCCDILNIGRLYTSIHCKSLWMSFFFVWYENLIAQFVGINSPKTDIGFMILCDLGA